MALVSSLDRFFGRIFSWCEKNPVLVIVIFFAVTVAIRYSLAFLAWRFLHFPFQRYDPYIYVVKGMEVAAGDWSPIRTHGIGWSAVLGVIFRVWHGSSVLENVVIASLVATLFSTLSIFPLVYIGRQIDKNPRTILLLLALFASSFTLTLPENDSIAMADPLFVFLFLVLFCFLYAARRNPLFLLCSGVVAGLAYAVKPVGLFIIPTILIAYAAGGHGLRRSIYGITFFLVAFIAVSAPFLIERHVAFGSFFNYGENSNYFSDTYTDAWGEAVSPVSFIQYFATHGILDFTNKFLVGGLLFVLGIFSAVMAHQFLGWLYAGASNEDAERNKLLNPIWITCAVWIIGLIPVFHVYSNPRHILPIIPLCFIVGAIGFRRLAESARLRDFAHAGMVFLPFLILIIAFSITIFFSKDKKIAMRDGAVWARDLAPRLKGNIAIGNGSDILMAQYPDSRVGGRGMLDMYAPQSGVVVRYPGKFDTVEAFRPWLKVTDIDYVVFDDAVKESFPFAPDKYLSIYTGTDFPSYLVPFYSNYESNSQWKVRVFRVNKNLL